MDQLSWDAWLSELEMENESVFLRETNWEQNEEEVGECFLRDILQDPTNNLSSETEAIFAPATVAGGGVTTNSVVNSLQCDSQTTPLNACVLSFDKSVDVIPDIADPTSYSSKLKRRFEAVNDEPPPVDAVRGTKKTRSGADATDHIMAERRRRQELTERFIALSATIPGLKKIDKATVLSEAISYVKQLQERVKELEQDTKNKMIIMEKPYHQAAVLCSGDDDNVDRGTPPAMSEVNYFDGNGNGNNDVVLPEVKARISDNKQVLIRILCKKQKSTMLTILDKLESLHLIVSGNSVMPFGSSTLDVTIVAQMSEEYSVSVEDIVKSLRMTLKCNGDPC
ncbi:hypothetical protein QN277_024368 [Acacia crassicarpa]|uniref:BHLH domain-containing protein n=1 Tax=Acacia crassicarpa TaxID=499986 RepID=A0AAE1JGI3_9FABA|nr:hypothetical protein QN277_024368 [Acacia crassicarpa]